LVAKACGYSLPAKFTSRSSLIKMLFKTDASNAKEGWSVSWSAVTPGVFHHNFHNRSSPQKYDYPIFLATLAITSQGIWENL
jgi:hypothetical protein